MAQFFNNAHYLSDLIGQHIYRVEVIDSNGELKWLTHDECEFAYDSSRFQRTHEVIVQAEFALAAGNKDDSMKLVKQATEYRAKTQPLGEPSSGCYFKNTPNTPKLQTMFPQFKDRREFPTAFLIDHAGLKGERVGAIEVSHKHAAFLINRGGGTSDQAKQLIQKIKVRVAEQFGVELQPEVFWLGANQP